MSETSSEEVHRMSMDIPSQALPSFLLYWLVYRTLTSLSYYSHVRAQIGVSTWSDKARQGKVGLSVCGTALPGLLGGACVGCSWGSLIPGDWLEGEPKKSLILPMKEGGKHPATQK